MTVIVDAGRLRTMFRHAERPRDDAHGAVVAAMERTWLCCVDGSGAARSVPGVLRRRRFESPSFAGFRFPPVVILLAVRWYLRYGLSYRDVEVLLAERGADVDRVTIYRRVQRFTPLVIDNGTAVPPQRRRPLVRRCDLRPRGRCLAVRVPSSAAKSSTSTSPDTAMSRLPGGSSRRCWRVVNGRPR